MMHNFKPAEFVTRSKCSQKSTTKNLCTFGVCFFWRIQKRICDLRSFGSWCIKGTNESLSRVDSFVPLMHHHRSDLRSQIRFWILQKKPTLGLMRNQTSTVKIVALLLNADESDDIRAAIITAIITPTSPTGSTFNTNLEKNK